MSDYEHAKKQGAAKPIHLRMLERSLNITPFLNYVKCRLNQPVTDEPASESDEIDVEEEEPNVEDVKIDSSIYFNLSNVGEERRWLHDVLLAGDAVSNDGYDENVVTERDLRTMLKQHVYEKKYRKNCRSHTKYARYKYYGASLLSKFDMYAENEKYMLSKKKDKDIKKVIIRKINRKNNANKHVETIHELDDSLQEENDWEDGMALGRDEDDDTGLPKMARGSSASGRSGSSRRSAAASTPEAMAIRRRKLWILMCKKEMGKVQRAKANNHKEQLQACKRTAQLCMKYCRQKAMQSQKNMKETIWRCKRLTREMQSYWKRYDRVEREMRKRMEKEAEEQRKMDVEMIEAKRQQRKLNFLITQTELYAHFMSRKLGTASPAEQLRILSQLDEKKLTRLAPIDDYDCEVMKIQAKKNVIEAIESDRARTKQFDRQGISELNADVDLDVDDLDLKDVTINRDEEHPQPNLFKGHLKGYQLKGMNWLANLYDQGISGILADEMGLGKTVQSIAFLCHVAEKYSVWGPFLVISPASTLHNWQQEMARFVPDFRVVPYWGNPNERKILRQFWEQKDLHTREASFHVVITSYQIIITDFKYFNRIKWQYMILDEAQAIKSSSSVRWKMLLGFSCRNRLLLSGTPIQNSMAELWALLHFIMPTLFDSHDEFNEWFSKDIENHVENKTGIDEKHLSRLHMILKPFMLRRIKKDVENELSDKIEVMVYCPLTRRQKLLYMALKKKIRIEDLLHYTVGGGDTNSIDKNFTSNLMNLVMQFRKVCNHPELFERRDAKSPLHIQLDDYIVPKLMYNSLNGGGQSRILFNALYIWTVDYITSTLRECPSSDPYQYTFSFARLMNISAAEIIAIFQHGLSELFAYYVCRQELSLKLHHRKCWWTAKERGDHWNTLNLTPNQRCSYAQVYNSPVLTDVVFTSALETDSRIYVHREHQYHRMAETTEHRLIRERCTSGALNTVPGADQLQPSASIMLPPQLPTIVNVVADTAVMVTNYDESRLIPNQRTDMPLFLFSYAPKVSSRTVQMYASSNECARHQLVNNRRITDLESSSVQSMIAHNVRNAPAVRGWFKIVVPDKETLVTDAGKLAVLDPLLKRLKREGHRVLIYSQMTKMIDLLEEYMWHRKHKYMRLDGSSKISERRDMVADFQARTDIFVFLLSTRAGGLGINLTAADTVIFYDSDWNPTVDQQAMDRAHRLGQTKQVTVYRLICKGTIEERILQRAREKSEIQRMVISGGNFKPDTLKPKEVVSLLLDDEEIEMKYRQKAEERKNLEEIREKKERDRKRKQMILSNPYIIDDMDDSAVSPTKRLREETGVGIETPESTEICSPTNAGENVPTTVNGHDDSSNDALLDIETPIYATQVTQFTSPFSNRQRVARGGARRGRPRGSRRGGGTGSKGRETPAPSIVADEASSNGTETVLMVNEKGETKAVPIRRGPGRPRLKPVGPGNQGTRGMLRPRKPVRALPVPLRSQSMAAALHNGSTASLNIHQQPSCFQFYSSPNPTS